MTQKEFAQLHSITIGTVKRWWKKGYLVGNKAINGRVTLTGKYTNEGLLALCGERNVLVDEIKSINQPAKDARALVSKLKELVAEFEESN